MRIAFITAGAAGMFCGSCLRDNTLVTALRGLGHDTTLIPTYTPIQTDEADVSYDRVFFGGINVYLQQKSWLFRQTPWLLDRLLDGQRLLKWVSRFASRTPYSELGELTRSMLQGQHGLQRKEVAKLVEFLRDEMKPDVVLLTNALLSGIVPSIRQELNVPVWVTLQGDDIFLDALDKPDRLAAIELIHANARHVTAFISTSQYYAEHMRAYLGLVDARIEVVYPGINLKGHGSTRADGVSSDQPPTIGYFARIAPEKGFHQLVDAYLKLRESGVVAKLRASGWLGEQHKPYFEQQLKKLSVAGFATDFEYVASPDHTSKVQFLNSIDLLCVPTTYREPKGLYVLEAWANGVPVVLPAHGTFPELVEGTNGGWLVKPDDTAALVEGLREAVANPTVRIARGAHAAAIVHERFSATRMAEETIRVLQQTP